TSGVDTSDSSPMYSAPIAVSTTTNLKARPFKTGATPSDVAPGRYTIQMRPGAPNLSAPANNATGVSLTPGFSWSAVTGNGANGSYRSQVATSAASLATDPDASACPGTCVINTTATRASYTPPAALTPGTTYVWQVHALGTLGGTWSTRFTFTTAAR